MGKQFSILLTDEANQTVSEYMQDQSCTKNKAINELIIANKDSTLKSNVQKLTKEVEELRTELNKSSTLLQDMYNLLQANQIIAEYMQDQNCTKNKAINELIIRNIDTPLKNKSNEVHKRT